MNLVKESSHNYNGLLMVETSGGQEVYQDCSVKIEHNEIVLGVPIP